MTVVLRTQQIERLDGRGPGGEIGRSPDEDVAER
jgi:hypothetical protein